MKRIALPVLGMLCLFIGIAPADWTSNRRLTWTSGSSNSPAIAVDSMGRLHLVWNDETPGNYEIYYKKSTNAGSTWTATKRLTWTSGPTWATAIAVDLSDRIHVVWENAGPGNYEAYYKKSTDGGETWSTTRRLTWMSGESRGAKTAVDSAGHLHVTWCDDTPGDYEIYHKKSTDGGVHWTSAKRLTWTTGFSAWPDIAASPTGDIHIVWSDDASGTEQIYYKRSSDGGESWSPLKKLTWVSSDLEGQDIVAGTSSCLHLIWRGNAPGNYEIYYKRNKDGGETWTAAERLTWTAESSVCPAMAAHPSGPLSIVWTDNTPGNWEIFYKKSTDGGLAWTSQKRLTWTSGYSYSPALVVDYSGLVHLVWEDNLPGQSEIYYKNGN